jgi:hypothetical protein
MRSVPLAGLGLAALLTAAVASELRISRPIQPPTDAWQTTPVQPRGATRLGFSYRTPQVDAFGLDGQDTLTALLDYPFDIVRLGAYWRRIEPVPGTFDPAELDLQVDLAERAGKQIVLAVGALKTFGYPEFFAPPHVVGALPEHQRIRVAGYPMLLSAATEFVERIVERYRTSTRIVAWQVEHEAVDPLGLEHSWRLDADFVAAEVAAVRRADPTRPILMNGYLPVSLPVALTQWWQTRDQGDSLSVALRLADTVGLDVYPRHALVGLGSWSVYLDARRSPWQWWRLERVLAAARARGKQVMISEGQAEPWEAVTLPPDPGSDVSYSCPPDQLIDTYNRCLRATRHAGGSLDAYLFWGAEYWMLRRSAGDRRYLEAVGRVLDESV